MRIEFDALRTVPGFRRALALALAFSGFLAISYLGLKDLETTTLTDARSALSSGAISGLVVIVYAAATAGGEVARGGLGLALIARRDRTSAVRDRLVAYAAAGACLGLGGACMATILTYLLLGFTALIDPCGHQLRRLARYACLLGFSARAAVAISEPSNRLDGRFLGIGPAELAP